MGLKLDRTLCLEILAVDRRRGRGPGQLRAPRHGGCHLHGRDAGAASGLAGEGWPVGVVLQAYLKRSAADARCLAAARANRPALQGGSIASRRPSPSRSGRSSGSASSRCWRSCSRGLLRRDRHPRLLGPFRRDPAAGDAPGPAEEAYEFQMLLGCARTSGTDCWTRASGCRSTCPTGRGAHLLSTPVP